ncbi:hypothetical protein E1B28_008220 [Marasmius oreades]|uniref:Uncharacterized protein n=1 Tax=Marasmius oreades TaxID=181124 RepID=A0A9P7URI8_9AGAR|nr:uncharacterized protein E1B28_008220 [Marasmius oreades]KAG7091817.1 hypothetical protein E1B28_008220 [Marasmius oreades]
MHKWYLEFSQDPLMVRMANGKGANELIWFRLFLWMELPNVRARHPWSLEEIAQNLPSAPSVRCLYSE